MGACQGRPAAGPFLTPISLTHAPPTSVLAPSNAYEVGDFIRANWAGRGVLYCGEVLAANHEDDTLDILYDDGDFESHVPRERVHPVSIELTDAFHAYGVGDVVKSDLKGHGSWYTGRIIAIDTKFRVFTIKYENGHLEKHVPPSRVQPMSTGHIKVDYVHGQRVRANWQSCGTWCLGRICAVNAAEGTFSVQYDDGEVELHVAAHSLQPAEDADLKATPAPEPEPLPFHCTLFSKAAAGGASSAGAGSSSGSSSSAAAAGGSSLLPTPHERRTAGRACSRFCVCMYGRRGRARRRRRHGEAKRGGDEESFLSIRMHPVG